MTTTPQPDREPTLTDVIRRLDAITRDIDKLTADFGTLTTELEQTQKWQDRTWDVVKWVGGISAGLAISAAIALVGIVLKTAVGQ